jgi:hypothetical protein
MDRSQEPTGREQEEEAPSDGPYNGGPEEPGRPEETGPPPGPGRRLALLIAAVVVLIPSSLAGWKWFQWTRSEAYQLQRIETQASALLPELEGTDAANRWIAMTALAKDGSEAGIRANAIGNLDYRMRALSVLTATLARAKAAEEAASAGRQLAELARVLEESASKIQDPLQRVTALKTIAKALAQAGLTEPARAVARRTSEATLDIPDAGTRSTTLNALALEFARCGPADLSQSFAREIDDPQLRSRAMTELVAARTTPAPPVHSSNSLTIARNLAREHRLREARQAAESCDQPADRLDAFTTIVGESIRTTKPELAQLIDELEFGWPGLTARSR